MEKANNSYSKFIKEAEVIYLMTNKKIDALKMLVENTYKIRPKNYALLIKLLLNREEQGSTIIAPKISLAHVETDLTENLILSFGFANNENINWILEENVEVKVIILLIFPIKVNKEFNVKIIKEFMNRLANQECTDKVVNVINAHDIKKILTE